MAVTKTRGTLHLVTEDGEDRDPDGLPVGESLAVSAWPVPAAIAVAGDAVRVAFTEWLVAKVANPNTREAYGRDVLHFVSAFAKRPRGRGRADNGHVCPYW